jgi:serine/threonine-protein kinase
VKVADFGIARAISAGGWDEVQLGRGLLGTPAYMSPEQAQNSSRVDGRSDLYSLGCVLYEMLTGEPPFRGSTPEELVVRHIEAAPEPVHARRPALTRELELLVGKALAKHPADRYQTAQQFAEAIAALGDGRVWSGPFVGATPAGPQSRPGWLRQLGLPGLAAAAVAYAVYVQVPADSAWSWRPGNPSLHLVAPFVHRDGAAPQFLSGDQCSRLIQEALSRWSDVDLVDARWTSDQVEQLGHEPTLDDLLRVARRAQAGSLISGEIYRFRDSIRVHGVLYDVRRRGKVVRERTVTLAGDLADADLRFTELADSLLLPKASTPAADGGAMGTQTVAAWQAYDAGHAALARWDLTAATARFTDALTLDPGYGLAHLWLAQTQSWSGAPNDVWRDHALAGLGAAPPLSPQDREWAVALAALAESHYPEACARYDAMIRRDSLDFRGWYGRGDCRGRDPLVLEDAKSPSGWRFRSSYQAAIEDYRKALTLIPSTHQAFRGAAFSRLSKLFVAETNALRAGRSDSTGDYTYAAYVSLAADTLAFIPWPLQRFVDASADVTPATLIPAVLRGRGLMQELTARWVRAFPQSASALESHARALELLGEYSTTPGPGDSALSGLHRARQVTGSDADSLRLAVAELRLLVKQQQFTAAQSLAESLLAAPHPPADAASQLAGVAILSGRPLLAAALQRQAAVSAEVWSDDGRRLTVPLSLRELALGLESYAAIGAPRDSIVALLTRAEQQLQALVGPRQREEVRQGLFGRAYTALGARTDVRLPPTAGAGYLLPLWHALGAGDSAAARRGLAEAARRRQGLRPGDVAIDATLQEVLLHLRLLDTAAAVTQLDGVLSALPTLGEDLVSRVDQSGALLRCMMLRARLAAAAGDRHIARQWSAPVFALTRGSDPSLKVQLDSLRRLAGPS